MYDNSFEQFDTIAILGGTFNPVHVGHIEMAKQVLIQYPDIEQLFLMPNHLPAYKDGTQLVSPKDRLSMLFLAVSGIDKVSVSDFEIIQDGYTYTVCTLRQILKKKPTLKIYFVIGDDSLFSFRKWFEYKEILKLCEILVIARDESKIEIEKYIASFKNELAYAKFSLVDMEKISVSSSEIRNNCFEGKSISGMVPKNVCTYIEEHNLYKYTKGSVKG